MSVQGGKLPQPETLLSAIDLEARATVKRAQEEIAPIVASETPKGRTGRVARAMRPRVSRTATGAALLIAPPKKEAHDQWATIAQVVRWVTRGTGLEREGPGSKNWVHAKRWNYGERMTLPGGKKRWRVKGQKANPFVARIYSRADPIVKRTFTEGATTAARAVETVIAREVR